MFHQVKHQMYVPRAERDWSFAERRRLQQRKKKSRGIYFEGDPCGTLPRFNAPFFGRSASTESPLDVCVSKKDSMNRITPAVWPSRRPWDSRVASQSPFLGNRGLGLGGSPGFRSSKGVNASVFLRHWFRLDRNRTFKVAAWDSLPCGSGERYRRRITLMRSVGSLVGRSVNNHSFRLVSAKATILRSLPGPLPLSSLMYRILIPREGHSTGIRQALDPSRSRSSYDSSSRAPAHTE